MMGRCTPLIRLFVTLTFSAMPLFAHAQSAGGGTSGGGNAVYTQTGELRLIDFLSDNDLKQIQTPGAEALKRLLKKTNPFAGVPVPRSKFFDCALEKIKNYSRFHVIDRAEWRAGIARLKVINVGGDSAQFSLYIDYFRSLSIAAAMQNSSIPGFSSRVPREFQITVAAYFENEIHLQTRLYSKLTEPERCGLQVHEAVRWYGDHYRTRAYTTDEVEAVTQDILGIAVQNPSALESAIAIPYLRRLKAW